MDDEKLKQACDAALERILSKAISYQEEFGQSGSAVMRALRETVPSADASEEENVGYLIALVQVMDGYLDAVGIEFTQPSGDGPQEQSNH